MKNILVGTVAALMSCFAAVQSNALVYDTSAAGELVGSRSLADPGLELTVSGGGNAPTMLSVGWEIDFNMTTAGLWHYRYTISLDQGNAISHAIFDLSDSCTGVASGCVMNPTFPSTTGTVEYGTFGPGSANPNLLGNITGIKFEDMIGDPTSFMITFDSMRAPVYGDVYFKAGSETNGWQVQNTGIDDHGTSDNILDFIARPDTYMFIPEPDTLALFGLGLAGLGFARRRKAA